MTDQDLVAAFLAKKGATVVATGARAMDEKTMYAVAHGTDTERAKAVTPEQAEWAAYGRWEKEVQEDFVARTEGWKR